MAIGFISNVILCTKYACFVSFMAIDVYITNSVAGWIDFATLDLLIRKH